MKTIIILAIILVTLYSCGTKSYNVRNLIYSDINTEVTVFKYSNNYILEDKTISVPNDNDFSFFSINSKKDTRQYLYKICRTNKTIKDTIMIYSSNKIKDYNGCSINKIFFNSSNNCALPKEFMNHLRDVNNLDYYELLPNQECIEIQLK